MGSLLLVLTASPASAAPITFTFTGTVTSVSSALAGSFDTSYLMSGFVTFDSALTDSRTATSEFGRYGGLSALEVTISGGTPATSYVATLGPLCGTVACSFIEVFNDNSGIDEQLEVRGNDMDGPPIVIAAGTVSASYFDLLLIADLIGGAFSDDTLPLVAPSFSRFDFFTSWELQLITGGIGGNLRGEVTSLGMATPAPAAVPEPATLLLLGSGLLGAGRLSRRRPRV